ncbi:MAG TPA: phosphomannomutase/phosphoglucomutase [Candidatus Paceibacterota bacterium]|nr:phosphomannomutase/phosphoglucomutase [Candidatus Paceibacterota bacterium]
MRLEPQIFKAYDIRGIYPGEIDDEGAYLIGRAYATLLQQENPATRLKVGVGSDMRTSSPSLKKSLIVGLTDTGLEVDDMGLVSTPAFYFGIGFFGYDGGIQVSASHNPKEWNGFKLVRREAVALTNRSGIFTLRDMITQNQMFPKTDRPGMIHVRGQVTMRMVEEQTKDAPAVRRFKIAIDPANGMGLPDMKALFEKLNCEIVWINDTLDGTFPAHPADPMIPSNLEQLRHAVLEHRCDLGIAPDGDGDRYFFIDEKGETVPQEILRGIMAQIALSKNPGASIVYDVRPGMITNDMILEAGGRPVRAPVGHSLIKEVMLAKNAVFAAESSGHYFYKFPYGSFEAPVVLILELLAFLTGKNLPVSQIVEPLRKYWNSGEINIPLEKRENGVAAMEQLKRTYADGKQSQLDGLSIQYPDYWFSVRLSNTEPLVRLILEARDKGTMERERDKLMAAMAKI